MKKALLVVLLAISFNANASQAVINPLCLDRDDYGGMQRTFGWFEADIENTTDQLQTVHIRFTNSMNGPWQPIIVEWDQQIAPHSWYHSQRRELSFEFHENNPSLYIHSVRIDISGFLSHQMERHCYYRVLKD